MALKLKKVSQHDLIRVNWVLVVCQECHTEQVITTDDEAAAQKSLHELGWRRYENDYESGGITCPKCINLLETSDISH